MGQRIWGSVRLGRAKRDRSFRVFVLVFGRTRTACCSIGWFALPADVGRRSLRPSAKKSRHRPLRAKSGLLRDAALGILHGRSIDACLSRLEDKKFCSRCSSLRPLSTRIARRPQQIRRPRFPHHQLGLATTAHCRSTLRAPNSETRGVSRDRGREGRRTSEPRRSVRVTQRHTVRSSVVVPFALKHSSSAQACCRRSSPSTHLRVRHPFRGKISVLTLLLRLGNLAIASSSVLLRTALSFFDMPVGQRAWRDPRTSSTASRRGKYTRVSISFSW